MMSLRVVTSNVKVLLSVPLPWSRCRRRVGKSKLDTRAAKYATALKNHAVLMVSSAGRKRLGIAAGQWMRKE